jgi:hypothetical protein
LDKGGSQESLLFDEFRVTGDRATVRASGRDEPVGLVRVDGRWYLDFISTLRRE